MSSNSRCQEEMEIIQQNSNEIMELASLANDNIKPTYVYPEPILLQLTSKLASYTIPGMRMESTTYDVPTYSALKGALDSIYKHKGAEAIPTAVYIHSPIKKTRIPLRNITGKDVQQDIRGMRSRECLTDVCYTVVVYIVAMSNMRNPYGLKEHYDKFLEYASGSCGMGFPFLGVMETPMYFRVVLENEIPPTQPITLDLGYMPLMSNYTAKRDPALICRHLQIENGVVDYTKGEKFCCYGHSKRTR